MDEYYWAVWLVLAVVLGVAELLSLELVLAMLAVGALAGVGTALIGLPLLVQVLVAGGASVAMLALVRPTVVKRLHTGPDLKHGHHRLIGLSGVATLPMSGTDVGRIRVGGEEWSAQPFDETLTIGAGESVQVFEIRGATAFVHPVPRLD